MANRACARACQYGVWMGRLVAGHEVRTEEVRKMYAMTESTSMLVGVELEFNGVGCDYPPSWMAAGRNAGVLDPDIPMLENDCSLHDDGLEFILAPSPPAVAIARVAHIAALIGADDVERCGIHVHIATECVDEDVRAVLGAIWGTAYAAQIRYLGRRAGAYHLISVLDSVRGVDELDELDGGAVCDEMENEHCQAISLSTEYPTLEIRVPSASLDALECARRVARVVASVGYAKRWVARHGCTFPPMAPLVALWSAITGEVRCAY